MADSKKPSGTKRVLRCECAKLNTKGLKTYRSEPLFNLLLRLVIRSAGTDEELRESLAGTLTSLSAGTREDQERLENLLAAPVCEACGVSPSIKFEFPFGLGAKGNVCTVLDCFLPRRLERWPWEDGVVERRVVFFPFLVVLERPKPQPSSGNELATWLPYWHLVYPARKPTRSSGMLSMKYGQWAPLMYSRHMESLLKQARAAGHDLAGLVDLG